MMSFFSFLFRKVKHFTSELSSNCLCNLSQLNKYTSEGWTFARTDATGVESVVYCSTDHTVKYTNKTRVTISENSHKNCSSSPKQAYD